MTHRMKHAYIAKDSKDPGPIEPGIPDSPQLKFADNRELLLRICEKLGVDTDE